VSSTNAESPLSSSPELSVVIPSVNGLRYLSDCLEALERNAPGAEVVVADSTDADTRRAVSERFPGVRLIAFDEPKTVPELRAAGIAAAHAPHVALIEDHSIVRDGWARRLLDRHGEGRAVVGGPVKNTAVRRIRDWAAFFCEYSEHMEPMTSGPTDSLTSVNISYDRQAIGLMDDLLREGRWETFLHPHLMASGVQLYADGDGGLDHDKDFGFFEFASQRFHYSRSHAGMRNPELGWKRAVYVAGSPLLVPMMYRRIAGNVMRKRRHRGRFLLATPLLLVYLAVYAAGEAVGYAFGGGQSLLKVK
jgi:glycosyltransferase involved in cell wall biosynthesis